MGNLAPPITDEFPAATVAQMRGDGRFAALVPPRAVAVDEVACAVTDLARRSASAALILAMHHIQVSVIVRHATVAAQDELLPRIARGDLLLANANSEVGLGSARRTSGCALEPTGTGFRLDKQASAVSYGEQADGILATARRHPDAPPDEQALAICLRPGLSFEPTGDWDTLGLRGTCSRGGRLIADVPPAMVIEDYARVFVRTSLPISVILLASVWLGIAEEAAARAHAAVRARYRTRRAGGSPQTDIGRVRLAELEVTLHQLRQVIAGAAADYERCKDTEEIETFAFAGRMTSVKIAASTQVMEIVQRAMAIAGLASYHRQGPTSMTGLLCDAAAAPLMVNNDEALVAAGDLMLVRKSL